MEDYIFCVEATKGHGGILRSVVLLAVRGQCVFRVHGPILSANFEYFGIMIFSVFHATVSKYLQCSCIQLFHT